MLACINTLTLEERETCCLDSGASMHIISKEVLNDAQMDTLTKSLSNDSHNRQWRSADAWRVHSLCRRIGFSWRRKSSRIRWTRVLLRVDQRSKTTSHSKRYSDLMQHGELRSYRVSWFINEFFLKLSFFNIHDMFKTGVIILHLPQARLLHQPQLT